MASIPSQVPSNASLAGFMQSITGNFGVESASEQRSIDETIQAVVDELGIQAVARPARWGTLIVEAADAPAAQALRYAMPKIEEALHGIGSDVDVTIRVAR